MKKIILIRHGQSIYNLENRFTGWKDVDLTEKGINEAKNAAALLKNYEINLAYTSKLKRAQKTLNIILDKLNLNLNVTEDIRLNERDYGNLVDQNKEEAAMKYGADQVQKWRRSHDIPPPNGESLELTAQRTLPYLQSEILPKLKSGKNIFIAAHGNSLRSIIMDLENLSREEVLSLEVPTGVPIIYQYEDFKWIRL